MKSEQIITFEFVQCIEPQKFVIQPLSPPYPFLLLPALYMYEYCGENTAKCLFVSLDKRAGFAFATKYVDRFFWLDGKVDGGGGQEHARG